MVILVDDGSTDDTVAIARELNLKLFLHDRNYGYGANQKTCYTEALKAGADIVVMVHPDYQYDPRLLPEIIQPIQDGAADVVLGSRLKSGSALSGGMPWWKYVSNRFLTGVENYVFGLQLSEYHTGYRAYRREVLETVNFALNADKFIFDQEIMAQVVEAGLPHRRGAGADALLRRGLVGELPRQHALRARHPLAGAALRAAPPRLAGASASSRACAAATASLLSTTRLHARRRAATLRSRRRRSHRGARADGPPAPRAARRAIVMAWVPALLALCCSTSRSRSGSGACPS